MIEDHLLLALLWILFCVFHSLLASGDVKRWIAGQLPRLNPFYRLFYTLFATVTFFYVVFYQLHTPSLRLLPAGFAWFGYPFLTAGAVMMAICVKKYFLSLSGLKSVVTQQPNTHDLKVEGVHQYVRHPLYLGTLVAIWGLFLVIPTVSLLLSNTIIHVYTLIGVIFEERKLLIIFGEQYRQYRRSVPKMLPGFRSGGKR